MKYLILNLYVYSLSHSILAHLLKSHQLHQSQTLQSPVQTILQPNQLQDTLRNESPTTRQVDGTTQGPPTLPPPKRLLQNFVSPTPTPPTPPIPRSKKEPMSVKFEPINGNKEEKVKH